MKSKIGKPGGILQPGALETKFQLSRYAPALDLGFFVQHYWIIEWDLRSQAPHVQEVIPYPCVNLTIERDKSRIYGVVTGKSTHFLEGEGRVFGVKFKPGGFYPFMKSAISRLTDASIDCAEVFGVDGKALEAALLSQADAGTLIALAECLLRAQLPARDEQVALINRIVDQIITDRTITRVDDLVCRFNFSKRTLQRIFSQYVGVSPKWVIRRYRLHEAAEQLAGGAISCARMALELGYFDQAHFIKDFKSIVDKSPAEYARNL